MRRHRQGSILIFLFLGLCAISTCSHADDKSPPRGSLLAPKAFRAAATQVKPSIVSIETFGGVSATASPRAAASFKPGEGPTTGVIISPDGYLLTSTFNFLDRAPIITVVFADGQRRVAKLLGRDDTRKICLLKVDDVADLPVPKFTPAEELRVGQWAVALGVGYGESEPALSAGIISALNRVSGKAIQTDANLSPANYGGPLVDIDGRVIGICVPLNPGSKETAAGAEWYDSGIGFAVPLSGLEAMLERLKKGETLQHGYLGIQAAPYGEPPAGAEVKKVLAGSAAEKAGLNDGDRILRVNQDEVQDVAQLTVLLNKNLLGDAVKLEIQRGEEKLTVEATLAEQPKMPPMEEKNKPDNAKKKEEAPSEP